MERFVPNYGPPGRIARVIGFVLALIVAFSLWAVIAPLLVQGSYQSTIYFTDDSKLNDSAPETNYAIHEHLIIDREPSQAERLVYRIPQQADNATQVLLKIYNTSTGGYDPEYYEMTAYRLTMAFDESYVTWNHRTESGHWTSPGGDYTTTNKVQFYADGASEEVWWTIDITAMALYEWNQDKDLYVVIKFDIEKEGSWDIWFEMASCENTDLNLRPKILVTWAEQPPPTVTAAVGTVLDDTATLVGTPKLTGWPNVTMQAWLSLHDASNYTIYSGAQNVTTDDPLSILDWSANLTASTEYDGRIYLTYNTNQTAFSNLVTFTTLNWTMPVLGRTATNITVFAATVGANWTANTDSKSIQCRVKYWDLAWPNFPEYTAWSTATTNTSDVYTWDLTDLCDNCLYYYLGQFLIEGVTYDSTLTYFTTGDFATLWASVESTDLFGAVIEVNYDTADGGPITLWCRVSEDNETIISPNEPAAGETHYDDLTGVGAINFTFSGLSPGHKYYYIGLLIQDGVFKTSPTTLYFYTDEIENPPIGGIIEGTFISPHTVQVIWPMDLNSAEGYNATATLWVRNCTDCDCTGAQNLTPFVDMGAAGVVGGIITWNLTVGEDTGDLRWDTLYRGYAVLDYTVGTLESIALCFQVPYEPFAIWTLDAVKITSTSYYFKGWVQMGPIEWCRAQFLYWIEGQTQKTATTYLDVYNSQEIEYRIDGLVYGTRYCYQIRTDYGATLGNVVCFTAGYEDEGGGWTPGIPSWTDFWAFLTSTAGHWLIMLVAMGTVGLIFFRRHKYVALIMCLVILGIGIVIGWIDPWVIVLLAIGGGLWLWRAIAGSRQAG